MINTLSALTHRHTLRRSLISLLVIAAGMTAVMIGPVSAASGVTPADIEVSADEVANGTTVSETVQISVNGKAGDTITLEKNGETSAFRFDSIDVNNNNIKATIQNEEVVLELQSDIDSTVDVTVGLELHEMLSDRAETYNEFPIIEMFQDNVDSSYSVAYLTVFASSIVDFETTVLRNVDNSEPSASGTYNGRPVYDLPFESHTGSSGITVLMQDFVDTYGNQIADSATADDYPMGELQMRAVNANYTKSEGFPLWYRFAHIEISDGKRIKPQLGLFEVEITAQDATQVFYIRWYPDPVDVSVEDEVIAASGSTTLTVDLVTRNVDGRINLSLVDSSDSAGQYVVSGDSPEFEFVSSTEAYNISAVGTNTNDIDQGASLGGRYTSTWNLTIRDADPGNYSLTVDVMPSVQTDGGATRDSVSFQVYEIDSTAPTISQMTPDGGETLSDLPVILEADVSDADFGAIFDDELTVEWYVDGTLETTTTITSNQTATVTADVSTSGEHTWYIKLTDDYGNTVTSETATFGLPAEIRIHPLETPTQILDNATAELTFFGDPGKEQYTTRRTTSNGVVSMRGLPVDEAFVAVVEVPNRSDRRIFFRSLLDNQDIYLLNESTVSVDVTFRLDDQTGDFTASESQLLLQRPIDTDAGFQFTTVAGDRFSPGGEVDITLERDQRYRLVLENNDGQSRALSEYVARRSELELLSVGEIDLSAPTDSSVAAQARLVADGDQVRVLFLDPDGETDSLNVTVGVDGEEIFNATTDAGPIEQHSESIPVTDSTFDPNTQTATVTVTAHRNGDAITTTRRVGEVSDLFGSVPTGAKRAIGWVVLLASMGLLATVSPVLSAMVGVGVAGLLTMIGLLSVPWLGILLAASIAILYSLGGGH